MRSSIPDNACCRWLSAKLNDRLAGCCPSCNLQIVFPVWFEGQHEHVLNQIVVQRSQNNEQLLRFRRNVCSIICVILVAMVLVNVIISFG
mmetsp:Transcript_3908/g.14312  ORF Transcript_3908/g.14312 Transcript_3908/m.14312 type:complete len:90 (-) Transcript_3908:150-419(-)